MMRAIDPTNGQLIEEVATIDDDALDRALDAAHAAFARWRRTSFDTRAALLDRLADLLDARVEALAATITREMGKPITEARAEIEKCAWACRYYRDEGAAFLANDVIASGASRSYVAYEPLGVVLAIMPWNFPIWQVIRCAAPALMAGNAVLLKHAPNVPGCARALAALFQAAGAGDGLFQNLPVDLDQTAAVIRDRRVAMVTLTGSVGAGRAVAALAGQALKPSVLELGGSDPFVVLDDADVDQAAEGAALSRFLNAGQSCIAAKRMIVHRAVYDAFAEKLVAAAAARTVGPPSDAATQLGPMAREDLRDALTRQVDATVAAGAERLLGGEVPDGAGWWYPATVLAGVRPRMCAFDEEVFGPVAALCVADDTEHAIQLASDTPFGLGAAVWSADVDRALEVGAALRSGHLSVNGVVRSDPRLPFGGVGDSGYGRELSTLGIRGLTNPRTIWIA